MTNETAQNLAAEFNHVARRRAQNNTSRQAWGVTVEVRDGRLVFLRYGRPEHSISVEASDEVRAWAHFNGFTGDHPTQPPAEGDRVTFRRGMYGIWSGTVTHVGTHKPSHDHRPGRLYFVVTFRKVNGATGTYRCETTDLVHAFRAW